MKTLALLLLFGCATWAIAQTPAPAPQTDPQSKDSVAPKPRPKLNLSLDPADQPRARITFEPREDKKPPAEQTLPGMGGTATRTWEAPSNKVFPPDTNPGR